MVSKKKRKKKILSCQFNEKLCEQNKCQTIWTSIQLVKSTSDFFGVIRKLFTKKKQKKNVWTIFYITV